MESSIVLLVAEEATKRASLEDSLQQQGFTVHAASSGPEAIDRILKDKPSLVLLDLNVPSLAGEEFCQMIKDDPFLRDIVVMILSSDESIERKLSCFGCGANDFLPANTDPREIVARINSFTKLIEEVKSTESPQPEPKDDTQRGSFVTHVIDKDKSFPTVDIVGAGASDPSVRIRPKYGVYRIETLIGSGAMGHVFKAYDEPLERFVAIKILSRRLSSSPAFVERFRREAKVLAAINHPGIAFIYSFGEEENEHYFAIQWCSGGSVADLIRKKQQVDILPALDIILQSARALDAASKKGVVHRDIKPSNILFDENQQVKIVDFGLASAEKMSARITQVQEFLGTPSFMAPEQAQSSSVDHRADIYSLGITFYYMLYGKLPFTAGTAIEMVIKHASHPFPSYESLDGRIPRQAFTIIEKMTRKNPEDRHPDYSALIQELEQLRNDLLIQSHWKIPKAAHIEPVPSLQGQNLLDLLAGIHNRGISGVLTVRWASILKRFLIRQREILLFESSVADENIWQSMQQKNILKKEFAPSKTEDMETALNRFLLARTFTMQEFKICYRDLMKAALMQVFFWPVFEGDFAAASVDHDAFASIRITEMILEAARSLLSYEMIEKEIPSHSFIARSSTFETVLSTLNLKPEESFIASRIEGQDATLDTLQLLTGLPQERVGRFVYALQKMGALHYKVPVERRPPRRLETPIAATVLPTPELDPTAPITAGSKTPEPFFTGGAKASTPAERSLNPGELKSKDRRVRMEVMKSDKVLEIEHSRKVADQFFRLAEEKYDWGDYWNVVQLCKQAIKNFPGESRYHHLMAKAYARHPKFGKDAEQSFHKALEMDPWNVDYHIDLSLFYLNNGLLKRAHTECQKAVKLGPQNEKAKKLMAELEEMNTK